MAHQFANIAFTPAVQSFQERQGVLLQNNRLLAKAGPNDRLGPDERMMIESRDGFYLGTVNEHGWPYIQFRGGQPGFLRMIDDKTIAYADVTGNRQYISMGNLTQNDRVSLFLMDYPTQSRLKLFGRARFVPWAEAAEWRDKVAIAEGRAKPERVVMITIEGFDWNCPQHITPRFTEAELRPVLEPMQARIERLEAENKKLKEQLSTRG